MKTIIYYDGNTLKNRIATLKQKLKESTSEEKFFIEKDIKKFEYALKEEEKILSLLIKSSIPMYILHDINIVYQDYKAQIDYIVITSKNCYIFECKNYCGNIVIEKDNNFFCVSNGEKTNIYSPIIQLDRHIDIIREYIYDQSGFIGKKLTNYNFNNYYKGAVIVTNELSQIRFKNKESDIRNKIVRMDKIVNYIKKEERKSHNYTNNEKEIKELAKKILAIKVTETVNDEVNETLVEFDKNMFNLDNIIKNKLEKYRYNKAKKLNYKTYYIFNDKTLNDLVLKKPQNIDELKNVHGLSDIKISKYGKEILKTINK